MDKTMADRAIDEPRRTAADSSWDVWSNYYFCPTLCRNCSFFKKDNSNWPYHCKATSSQARSHTSKKDGYKQYDDCICYKESSKETVTGKNVFHNKQNEVLQKTESISRFQPQIVERDSCFYCNDDTGHLEIYHDEYFHIGCYDKFIENEKGKQWLEKKENQLKKRIEENNKKVEQEKKQKEFLESEEGKVWLEEQRKIENKKREDEEKKEKEQLNKLRLHQFLRTPIFVAVSIFSIYFTNGHKIIPTLNASKLISSIISWIIILWVYYKLLGYCIDTAFDTINKKLAEGYQTSFLNNSIVYFGIILIATSIHCLVIYLTIHFLLKIW